MGLKHRIGLKSRFGSSPTKHMHLMRNMVGNLFLCGGVRTTQAKAKALRPWAERMISKAKRGTPEQVVKLKAFLFHKDAVQKALDRFPELYADREGGYTTMARLPPRKGDRAPMAFVALVDTPAHEYVRQLREVYKPKEETEAKEVSHALPPSQWYNEDGTLKYSDHDVEEAIVKE